jgi:hypothetical protein
MTTTTIPLTKPYDIDSFTAKINTQPIIKQIIISVIVAIVGCVLIVFHKDIYWGLVIFGNTTTHISHFVGIVAMYFAFTAIISSIRKQREVAKEETRQNHNTYLYYVVYPAVRQFFTDENKWHNGYFINITYHGKAVVDVLEEGKIRELYHVYLDKDVLRIEESALTALNNNKHGVK